MKKALDLIRQHPRLEHHPARLPQILRDMGILYAYMSDRHFQRAIALIEQSEAVSRYRQLDNSLTLAQIFRAWGLSLHGDSQREHGASEAALKLYDQAYRLLDSVIPQVVEKKYYRQQALLYRLLADTLIKLPYPDNRLELAHKYLELASGFAEPFYKAYVQAELSKSWGDWYLAVGNRELAQLSYRNAYHLAVVWGLRHKPGNLLQRIQQLDGGENIRRQAKSVDTPGKNDSSEPTSSKIRFIQPDNHPFESQIKTVIDELRSDAIRQHPTKSEQILNLFLQQPYHEITLREMVPLFAGTYNPEQAARNLIAKLNAKLGQVGCRIEHVAAYRIVSASQSK